MLALDIYNGKNIGPRDLSDKKFFLSCKISKNFKYIFNHRSEGVRQTFKCHCVMVFLVSIIGI